MFAVISFIQVEENCNQHELCILGVDLASHLLDRMGCKLLGSKLSSQLTRSTRWSACRKSESCVGRKTGSTFILNVLGVLLDESLSFYFFFISFLNI